ncbi:MAG TPA: hypothetical protein VLE99_02060 [Candidatus Saccharimonadales bacterium]|nr:hypothetical protein [Candidatus Saccharimonadales bacterium]
MGRLYIAKLANFRRALATCGFSFLMAAGMSLGWASQAAAVTCRNTVNPPQAGTATEVSNGVTIHYGYTNHYIVPSSSDCIDINIVNVTTNYGNPSQHCMIARVRFYPSSGGSFVNDWQSKCSVPPNGAVVAVATDVLNGTEYRLEYQMSPPLAGPAYTLRD